MNSDIEPAGGAVFRIGQSGEGTGGAARISVAASPGKAAEAMLAVQDPAGGGSWRWRRKQDGSAEACFDRLPPKQWLVECTKAAYGIFGSAGPAGEEALRQWKECVAEGLARLPRILLAKEEEPDGLRRKKRFIFAAPDYEDVQAREIIRELGFRWDTRRMYSFYGQPEECSLALEVLSRQNERRPSPVVDEDGMYKYFPTLKPEQDESIRFIFSRWKKGWRGALVADDMGVGKTLTALVAGKLACGAGLASKIVVFANTANLKDWLKEWSALAPGTAGPAFALTKETAAKAKYKNDPEALAAAAAEAELLIVNYEYAARNAAALRLIVGNCGDAVTVFDEVTKCSNRETENFKAAFKASMSSRFSIGLSGTPISKEIFEGWSIMRLLDPAIYPQQEFYDRHRVEKKRRIWDPRNRCAREIIDYEYRAPEEFRRRVEEHFIRHEKDGGTIEAEKVEKCYFINPKRGLLETAIADRINRAVTGSIKKEIDWDLVMGGDSARMPRWQLSALGYIQSALDDPYVIFDSDLFKRIEAGDPDVTPEQRIVYDVVSQYGRERLEKYVPAKIRFVESLLRGEWCGKRAILFFTSSRACERAAGMIAADFPEKKVFTVVGALPAKKRDERIEEFRNSPGSVVCCTDAMAFGCNLQFADVLAHMNMPWSTAVWKQRSDRIFRTGAVGRKEIVYLMHEHPLERRKITVMKQNLETIRRSLDIEMTALPEEIRVEEIPSPRAGARADYGGEEPLEALTEAACAGR